MPLEFTMETAARARLDKLGFTPDKTRAVFLRNPFSTDPSDLIYKTGDLAKVGHDSQAR